MNKGEGEGEDFSQDALLLMAKTDWRNNTFTKEFFADIHQRYDEIVVQALHYRSAGENDKALERLSYAKAFKDILTNFEDSFKLESNER